MLSTVLIALAAGLVSAAPISHIGTVESTPSLLPNATQYNASVVWYKQNSRAGACGNYSSDEDFVVGLPLEFYTKLDEVSPYCGEYVVVTNTVSNGSVVAKVADASTLNNTLSVSVATWQALNGTADNLHKVNWRRANETEIADAKKQAQSVAPSSTSSWVAPSSTSTHVASSASSVASKEWKAPVTSSSSAEHSSTWTPSSSSAEHTSSWTPSSSSSAEKSAWTPSSSHSAEKSAWTPSSSSASSSWSSSAVAEKKSSSTSTWTPPATTSSAWSSPAAKSTWSPEPTTTSKWTPTTTTEAPKETKQSSSSSGNTGAYSGQATWFTQDGNAGSCGNYNSDYTNLVALSYSQVNGGSHCGQYVNIKNTANGRTVTAIVADTCPGCGYGSLDLSLGAFDALGSRDQGVLPISWSFA